MLRDDSPYVGCQPLAALVNAGGWHCGSSALIVWRRSEDTHKHFTRWKRKTADGILTVIGFMLSPLSWWNDLFVNWPLALAFAWVVSAFFKPAFAASLILGYWLTNILGFILMQKGGEKIISGEDRPYSRKCLLRDLAISILYTLLMVALVRGHWYPVILLGGIGVGIGVAVGSGDGSRFTSWL